ncbi:hypothetical protein [Massilia sp. LC238]|jgi:hypothetical protein|uniref:hypothetical protein n=1 Tax=Massilia sp. LC238 TaxID=1502852 RepID=UPI0004E39B42|nr:hypothetical protein [Massilia sp. LC238]KFC73277.1 hypothetical protein FG94_01556 [Massilia sp. LC238]
MKLKNRNPAKFVGRTIIYRHQAWKIDSVSADKIHLSKPGLTIKGQIGLHQFADCRLFPTREEVIAQFPKLIRALGRVCKLSQLDAAGAIRGQVTTGSYYMDSEALALLGGSANAMDLAWRGRHKVRR